MSLKTRPLGEGRRRFLPPSEDPPLYLPSRFYRTCFHGEASQHPVLPRNSMSEEDFHFLCKTVKFFEALSYREPERLPDRMLDAQEVLHHLTKLDRSSHKFQDFKVRRKLNDILEMSVEILFLLRIQSDYPLAFDADCVYQALRLKSDYAALAVVLFFEQEAKPEQRLLKMLSEVGLEYLADPDRIQVELLAEMGSASHGRLRQRIRRALKNLNRQDLLAELGSGGPPIAALEQPAEETAPRPDAK